MSKKKALIKETVARRWGKLANIQPLTENWLDETELYREQEETRRWRLTPKLKPIPWATKCPEPKRKLAKPLPARKRQSSESLVLLLTQFHPRLASRSKLKVKPHPPKRNGPVEMEAEIPMPRLSPMEMGGEEEEEAPAMRGCLQSQR